jgi:limonene-1,2-epoxide hydrolase
MSNSAVSPDQIVREFCEAWGRNDLDAIVSAFADDAVYHNIPMAPVAGVEAIREYIGGFMAMGSSITFETLHQVSDGRIVMNERIDTIVMEAGTKELPVMGIFEVDEGKITKWRDYFDLAQLTG